MTHETPLVLQHLKKALLQLQSAKGVLILEEMKDSQAYLRTKSAISQADWAIQEIESCKRSQAMSNKNDDFAPIPTYRESTKSNGSWVNVTLTRTNPDGTTSQTSTIVAKAK